MDMIPSDQKILYIVEESDSIGLQSLENEAAIIDSQPTILSLDQRYLDSNSIDANGILHTSYNDLRVHLQGKKYDKLFFYSLSSRIFQILDGSDTSETSIIFRSNVTFLYHEFDSLHRPYFSREVKPSNQEISTFLNLDRSLSLYSTKQNVTWLFSSVHEQLSVEGVLGYNIDNAKVISSLIDINQFQYSQQRPSNSTSICAIKDFSNLSRYAVDVDVKTILELSTKPFFNQLTISLYGYGPKHDYDILVDPIRSFPNVILHERTPTKEELSSILKNNDFLLCADRFDSNKQVIIEAGLSGCFPITSTASTIAESAPSITPYLSDPEDYQGLVQSLEELMASPEALQKVRKDVSNEIELANSKNIKAYESILAAKKVNQAYPYKNKENRPVLSVVVPSYNVEPFLRNTVFSLINHPLSHKIEVIIVNDGSKDDTAKIANELVKLSKTKNGSIVTLIDKENGGHGSTINAGIAKAKGKYFRLLDGDDYVFTDNFIKLIEILEKEESDIVLTDLIEDYGISAEMIFKDYYRALIPGQQRDLDFMHANGYGFGEWGPLLSTTNVKTDILKRADFKIDENCFYVDMEYNFIIYTLSKTVAYYPIIIYSYYLGRIGQSMSKESLKRNVLHHEKVTLRLLAEYEKRKSTLSEGKRIYLKNKMIIPMCKSQYYIATEMFNDGKHFLSFDEKFRDYPDFYNNPEIAGKIVRLHRKTRGNSVRVDKHIKRLKYRLKKG